MRVDYQDGTGTGNILWRMGNQGDFALNNVNNDRWPWFSHQHEAGIEANGDLTVFDNGNTRVGQLGGGCGPNDCDSRGMSLQFNESTMRVTPILSDDLGGYSVALGSAQLLNQQLLLLIGFHQYFVRASYRDFPDDGHD
jgi:arylsulfate sulfotransferase